MQALETEEHAGPHNGPQRSLPPLLELAPSDPFAIYAVAPHLLLATTSQKPKPMTVLSDVSEADQDSPFQPPYRSDTYVELPVIELHAKAKAALEAHVQSMHQELLMTLVRRVAWCPEPLPFLLHPNCPPSESEIVRSDRMHAVLQLLSQLREQQHQALLRKIYKAFGSDHRKAAKELYARELFAPAYIQYWTLYNSRDLNSSAIDRTSATVDLLEKLAVTCLRAGWLGDAEKFATTALEHDRHSTRARVWLATAQLGLGNLAAARRHLALLPARGAFPASFPAWIEGRVQAQRAVLDRLEREAAGTYDLVVLARDPPDMTPPAPYFTTLCAVQRNAKGLLHTTKAVSRGALLMVAHPIACVPCCTTAAAAVKTLHAEDPALLTLSWLADAIYTQAKTSRDVRAKVLAAGTHADTAVVDLVGNNLRAAAIFVAQKYSVSVPHVKVPEKGSVHAGHAVYLPLIDLCGAGLVNTYATFCGPHLFLRAMRDLDEGTILAFDGFDGDKRIVRAPSIMSDTVASLAAEIRF